jgi:hypothetical protein
VRQGEVELQKERREIESEEWKGLNLTHLYIKMTGETGRERERERERESR